MTEQTKELFYCNRPCTLLADLGDEVFIEMHTHTYESCPDSYDCHYEPYFAKMVVSKEYISEKSIDPRIEFEEKLKKLEEHYRPKYRAIENDFNVEKQKVKNLNKRLEKLGQLEFITEFFEGHNELWVLEYDIWRGPVLKQLKEHKKDDVEVAVVFKRANGGEIALTISTYSDGSGGGNRAYLYRTKSEAIKGSIIKMCKDKKWDRYITFCRMQGIDLSQVEEAEKKAAQNMEEYNKKKKIKLEKELASLQ